MRMQLSSVKVSKEIFDKSKTPWLCSLAYFRKKNNDFFHKYVNNINMWQPAGLSFLLTTILIFDMKNIDRY